jgi:oxygen-dependent protoporphyrinogen oxidase
LRAAVPPLWEAASTGGSLTVAAAAAAASSGDGPVFAGFRGGLGEAAVGLAHLLVRHGVDLRTGTTVRELLRTPTGWRVVTGPTIDERVIEADGVVLAVPAAPTARLLRPHLTGAAHRLGEIEYASVAIVTLALPRTAESVLTGSGFLVPPVEPLAIKAATFSSTKWAWVDEVAPDVVLLRASLGRAGETAVLQRDDSELVAVAVHDLRHVLGALLPEPVDAHVQRWGGALPQYAVGHLDRVAAVRAEVATLPALGLAGAAYSGVGVPACVATGRDAAQQVIAALQSSGAGLRPSRVEPADPALRQ